MRLAWLTDIHLDFLDRGKRSDFLASLGAVDADALLVGGDIGEAPTVDGFLRQIAVAVGRPVFFVLGNHDFYRDAIARTRDRMRDLCRTVPHLVYLSQEAVIPLTESTALVGHDGWGDGRYGNFMQSPIRLNDHLLIAELTGLPSSTLLERLNRLGDEAASHLKRVLPNALASHPRVLLLTHVPPFQAACWYQGRTADNDWAPFFSCKAVGDLLVDLMSQRPDRHMTVLCGHTHNSGKAEILKNLVVWTGGAEYGTPEIQPLIEVC